MYNYTGGRVSEALVRARELLVEAERQNVLIPIVMGRRLVGTNLVMARGPDAGLPFLERALEDLDEALSDEIGFVYGQDCLSATNCYVAFAQCALGRFVQMVEQLELALDRVVSLNNPLSTAYIANHFGLLFGELDNEAGLARCIDLADATLKEHPWPLWIAVVKYLWGVQALNAGRYEDAASLVRGGD